MGTAGRSAPIRRTGSLLGLVGLEAGAVLGLHWLGRFPGLRVGWAEPVDWLLSSPVQEILGSILRMVGLVMAYWLLASTLIYLLASLTRLPGAIRAVRWATLPLVRRVADHALAVTLATSMVGGGSLGVAGPALAAPQDAPSTTAGEATQPSRPAYTPEVAGQAPDLRQEPNPGQAPVPSQEPNPGQAPTPSQEPNPGQAPVPSQEPNPGQAPSPGQDPAPGPTEPVPSPSTEPSTTTTTTQPATTTTTTRPVITTTQPATTTTQPATSTSRPATTTTRATTTTTPPDATRGTGRPVAPRYVPEVAGQAPEGGAAATTSTASTTSTTRPRPPAYEFTPATPTTVPPGERESAPEGGSDEAGGARGGGGGGGTGGGGGGGGGGEERSGGGQEEQAYRVVRGDNLWVIAREHLERARSGGSGAPTNREVAEYWLRVVEANRDRLRSGDPDLIYPGERLTLPPVD